VLRKFLLIVAISQLSGCAWIAANALSPITCFNGTKAEFEDMMPLVGPLIIIDLPFTLVADTLSVPACLM
jgi:uncharacterized protein YceK